MTQVCSFLGLASYNQTFIENCSEIAHTLINLTRKRTKFHWTVQRQQAFKALKECLVTAPVLTYPMREGGDFILDTDASSHGMSAVLFRVQNGEEKAIAHASQALGKSQLNYFTAKKELLAVVTFVEHFRHYLHGRHLLSTQIMPL